MSEHSDNIDIERAAFGLVRNHGLRAEYECFLIVKRWEGRGDNHAADLWRSVLRAVRKKVRVD